MHKTIGRACFVALLALGTVRVAAEGLRIVPVTNGDRVVVSVELVDSYTKEIREAIASGLRTSFTYDVELRMVVPVWVDRTIATSVINITDQYDNLTRRHSLSRIVDGRVEESLVTEDEDVEWNGSNPTLGVHGQTKARREAGLRIAQRVAPLSTSLW